MITTNKTQPKEQEELKKSKVITANELEPKGFDFTTREYPDVDKRETSKVEGPMLTTENMDDFLKKKRMEEATKFANEENAKWEARVKLIKPVKKRKRKKK